VEGEVDIPGIIGMLATRVEDLILEIQLVWYRGFTAVKYFHMRGKAALAGTVDDSIVCVGGIVDVGHEAARESHVTMRIEEVHGFASGDSGPLINIVIVSRRERVLIELMIGRLEAVGVGDDASCLSKLLSGDVLLIVKLGDVGPEVIVAVVDSSAGVEVDVDSGELGVEDGVFSVISDGDGFGQINLGAVRSANGWHLFNASTHGRSRNILDVSTLVHVIIHAHEEQIVRFVSRGVIVDVVRPREAVAMNGSLALVVIARKNYSVSGIEFSGGIPTLEVDEAEIGIVGGIVVNAVLVVRLGAIPVVVIRLTILRPAAHSSIGRTGGQTIRVIQA